MTTIEGHLVQIREGLNSFSIRFTAIEQSDNQVNFAGLRLENDHFSTQIIHVCCDIRYCRYNLQNDVYQVD